MAGGVGSRFWPASQENNPKQFLDIMGTGKSLIRLTFERFLNIVDSENIYVVTLKKYKDKVLEHIPELRDDQVICEPSRNNTAPCIAYATSKLMSLNHEANIVVAPADHIILNKLKFNSVIEECLAFTFSHQCILTLGINPSRPDTGYGYIEMGQISADHMEIRKVNRFAEKPVLELAKSYLEKGNYVWNSGLFIFRADTILESFNSYAPEIINLLSPDQIDYNTDKEVEQIEVNYPQTPKISIDYAIMEKAQNIYVYPSEFGWSDLGTWNSLHNESEKDQMNNVIQSETVLIKETKNCLIRSPMGKTVIVKGLDSYIIVDENDVLLIYPKDEEQEIKQIAQEVRHLFGDESK